jgi:hypothetical protein
VNLAVAHAEINAVQRDLAGEELADAAAFQRSQSIRLSIGLPATTLGRSRLKLLLNPTSRIRSWKSGFYDFSGFVSS